mgnify:CR=1 FL=1
MHCASVTPNQIPISDEVVEEYRMNGGQISVKPTFGEDPLNNDANRKFLRDQEYFANFPSFEEVSFAINNHQGWVFEQALLGYLAVTFNH